MENKIKYLGLIPARKGSKGFVGKNKHVLLDKPLIEYSIHATKKSRIDFILLSTDDEDIIAIGKANGIHVPFVRPEYLSNDGASQIDVIKHALEWFYSAYHYYPESVLILQPTSPLRTFEDINNALSIYESKQLESLISVCKVSQHPAECLLVDEDGNHQFINLPKKSETAGRQSYYDSFFIDGGIYISKTEKFLKTSKFYDKDTYLFEVPKSHAIDIDDSFDMYLAKAILHYARNVDSNILEY